MLNGETGRDDLSVAALYPVETMRVVGVFRWHCIWHLLGTAVDADHVGVFLSTSMMLTSSLSTGNPTGSILDRVGDKHPRIPDRMCSRTVFFPC